MNDLGSLSDLAAGMIITGVVIFLALSVYFVSEVIAMITSKQSKPKRIDPFVAAWPSTILPCQSWVGREIEAAAQPWCVTEAEYIAAMAVAKAPEFWEMSPVNEEGEDD